MTAELWWDIGMVLAAGAGRRYGQPKAGVQFQGERLVDRAVRVLTEGGCKQVRGGARGLARRRGCGPHHP